MSPVKVCFFEREVWLKVEQVMLQLMGKLKPIVSEARDCLET